MSKIYENYAIFENKGNKNFSAFQLEQSIGITQEASDGSKKTIQDKSKEIDFFFWGASNNLPNELIEKAYKNTVVASNLDFNSRIAYGDIVQPVRKIVEKNEIKYVPLLYKDAPEIFDFLENSNMSLLVQELAHDISLLNNGFVELIMNQPKTKVLQLRYKEATFSRLSVMNEKGNIEYHGYCSNWEKAGSEDYNVVVTPLLDYDNPLFDLQRRMGLKPGPDGKKKFEKEARYIVHIAPPAPGKFYYQKAYWWSIFESQWYDFSNAIPSFKMNLMKNQMVLKYHVKIRRGFFDKLFQDEGITEPEKQTARKKQFFIDMDEFLSGNDNAGKNLISEFDYDFNKGIEKEDLIIKSIESFIKGGEYIEDSEEASNAICYAMGVHPSLQGASPGKNKTISGTEARELFTIKQAMMKPIRDLLLLPLKIVKKINKWDEDIDFIIPNIMLTTLDKNTGAEKQIGNEIQ